MEDRSPGTQLAAWAAVSVVGVVVSAVLVVAWYASPSVTTGITVDDAGDVVAAAEPVAAPHLRVHLVAPQRVVAGHRQTVTVTVSDGGGMPLDPDEPLVVTAKLSDGMDDDAGVVLLGPDTWTTTAGTLARTPLRLLTLGEPRCGRPAADLLVRVRTIGDEPVEVTRTLWGPTCDAMEVIAAPDTVNLDVPVPYTDDWREVVDRLLNPPEPTARPQARRTTSPTPRSSPSRRATPSPTPTAEATVEPEPEPEPEPTETATEDPEPTPSKSPSPSPTKDPSPSPTKSPSPSPTKDPSPSPTPSPTPTESTPPPPGDDDEGSD